jgi:hypothetical protein
MNMSHSHTHEHEHEHEHRSEPRLAPSRQGTVVLDIGDGVGALVVHTAGALNGVEIELAHRGEDRQFVHTDVRERVLPEGTRYAGVFPAVVDGEYTLLAVDGFAARDVTIRSGRVTEVDLTR